jgi:hypothetical protein
MVYGIANERVTKKRVLWDLRRRKRQEIGKIYLLRSFITFIG